MGGRGGRKARITDSSPSTFQHPNHQDGVRWALGLSIQSLPVWTCPSVQEGLAGLPSKPNPKASPTFYRRTFLTQSRPGLHSVCWRLPSTPDTDLLNLKIPLAAFTPKHTGHEDSGPESRSPLPPPPGAVCTGFIVCKQKPVASILDNLELISKENIFCKVQWG